MTRNFIALLAQAAIIDQMKTDAAARIKDISISPANLGAAGSALQAPPPDPDVSSSILPVSEL